MLRILLVEDNPDDRTLVGAYLKRGVEQPCEVLDADRLSDALQIIGNVPIDICLLDMELPDSFGLDTLKTVHAARPSMPIVVISGNTDKELALQALGHGAHDYFVKNRMNPEAISRVVRFAIERGKRVQAEQDLRTAEQVQRLLFPRTFPRLRGYDVAGQAFSAASGCGDYFDFIPRSNGSWLAAVGDVSGHGMAAALRMVEARAYLRVLSRNIEDVGTLLTELNLMMLNESQYDSSSLQQFITMFIATMDEDTCMLNYASAGHAAYIVRHTGGFERLHTTGVPLGIAPLPTESQSVKLYPGDICLIATDGLEETMNPSGELFGIQRVLGLLEQIREEPAEAIVQQLYNATRHFAQTRIQADDETLIVLKREFVHPSVPAQSASPILSRRSASMPALEHPSRPAAGTAEISVATR